MMPRVARSGSVEVIKVSVQRSAVRSIAWLGRWPNRQLIYAHPVSNLRLVKLSGDDSATLLVSNALGGLVQCATARDVECTNTASKPLVLARDSDTTKRDELGANLAKTCVAPILVR